ncbi:MarR family transcriptional regulator for hemolysin [Erwinia persicina]|uniref:MarR family winged helix-turn-helix transcriptional regulator n=2 Tax=Erwinia TaxID=551 RepID=A0ABV4E3Y8_9GAMM|nr:MULTISPECIES: MarR family transcriptional regulator [Erwinia]MCP1437419.1 MarR family transcriptional regulator for hemolysin [Erwinia persicina]MDN4626333.1 MarR family transcriptional regulator [Erwinia sp. PsM31]MDN8540788.1 MarR family transcriptional regulator [Erwinia sp. BC051422]
MNIQDLTFSRLLHLTAQAWRQAIDRRVKEDGLTTSSWMAIATLATQTAPVSQKELALALGLEEATIVPLVDRLVKQQLVVRTQPPEDRRKRLVAITPAGTALHQQLAGEIEKLRNELLATISRDELIVAQRVLQKLLKATEAK